MQLQTQRYAVTSAAQHLQNSMSHQSHLSHESAGVGQRLAPYDVFWMVPRFVVVSLFTEVLEGLGGGHQPSPLPSFKASSVTVVVL